MKYRGLNFLMVNNWYYKDHTNEKNNEACSHCGGNGNSGSLKSRYFVNISKNNENYTVAVSVWMSLKF